MSGAAAPAGGGSGAKEGPRARREAPLPGRAGRGAAGAPGGPGSVRRQRGRPVAARGCGGGGGRGRGLSPSPMKSVFLLSIQFKIGHSFKIQS